MPYAFLESGSILFGSNETYEINVTDIHGKIIRKIKKEYDPVSIEPEVFEEQTKRLKLKPGDNLPKDYPAFQHLSADDEGRIFVQTYEKDTDGSYYYDVFEDEGRFLAKIKLKFRPHVWMKSKMYSIEENEEGYQIARRYKVTWNY